MTFNPCLLIPVFNHAALITDTLARLKPLGLPCLIIDDGSDDGSAALLVSIVKKESSWLSLFSQQPNKGKGAAVIYGIKEAKRLGFSHAVQVDADGQHALEDIPVMLEMAKKEPDALISGAPIYDESVPKSRLYGRYITHFWVWIETLSFSIVDSMCGFRVYPVEATCKLAACHSIAKRMDFDTDIMVRLFWRNVPVRFLPTKVSYPDNGISHFSLLKDNLRITRMHTILVLGMLLRLPAFLQKKTLVKKTKSEPSHWSEMSESGAYFGLWFSVTCYRLLGRRAMSLLLFPIITYFFLSNRVARHASRDFLQKVYDFSRPDTSPLVPATIKEQFKQPTAFFSCRPSLGDSFKHFMSFGHCIIDRLGSWSGEIRRDEVIFHQRELLIDCVARGQGGVIFASHLGNAELCRSLVDSMQGVKMNVLAFSENAGHMKRLMERINPRTELELIQVTSVGPETAFLLSDKISRGEFIVITADRTSPTAPEKSLNIPFLGQPAAFPQGAFILAGLLEAPVFLLFCLKQDKYNIYFEHFADSMKMPRKHRQELLEQYIGRYVQRLQYHALLAPLQWFNFFDYWVLPAPSLPKSNQQKIQSNRSTENG